LLAGIDYLANQGKLGAGDIGRSDQCENISFCVNAEILELFAGCFIGGLNYRFLLVSRRSSSNRLRNTRLIGSDRLSS